MYKKCRLKGTKLRFENDYHPNIRLKRKLLLKHLWEARKAGKFAVLIHDKLKIGKNLYNLEDLENSDNQRSVTRQKQVETIQVSKNKEVVKELYHSVVSAKSANSAVPVTTIPQLSKSTNQTLVSNILSEKNLKYFGYELGHLLLIHTIIIHNKGGENKCSTQKN